MSISPAAAADFHRQKISPARKCATSCYRSYGEIQDLSQAGRRGSICQPQRIEPTFASLTGHPSPSSVGCAIDTMGELELRPPIGIVAVLELTAFVKPASDAECLEYYYSWPSLAAAVIEPEIAILCDGQLLGFYVSLLRSMFIYGSVPSCTHLSKHFRRKTPPETSETSSPQ